MRDWAVAGGVVLRDEEMLLVRNRRRNRSVEWSTPGGVVDPGETFLQALGREVREETGLHVSVWEGPLYEITVEFVDLKWLLRVQTHQAMVWSGEIEVCDPDGIVEHADFYALRDCETHLLASPRWVHEPLLEWVQQRPSEPPSYHYMVTGTQENGLTVTRR